MRLGESRPDDARLAVAALQLVRGWVWLYTLGLPLETRSARRKEIDSDMWEHTHAFGLHGPSTSSDAWSTLLRCLRGVLADVLWRLAEARIHPASTEGRPTAQTLTMRSWFGLATIILTAVLVMAAIALMVVHSIEYENPSTRIIEPWLKIALGTLLLAVGLFLTVGGFRLIGRAPWIGAVLAIGGVWMVASLFYWMWFPLFVAAVVSVATIREAREVHARKNAGSEF